MEKSSDGSIVVNFALERETAGALRFQEVGEHNQPLDKANAVVGTLYIRKAALKDERPARVRVTLETLPF